MRLEIIIDRAKATGLPLAKDAFRETKENPLPVPPYLVYIVPQVVGRGRRLSHTVQPLGLFKQQGDYAMEEI